MRSPSGHHPPFGGSPNFGREWPFGGIQRGGPQRRHRAAQRDVQFSKKDTREFAREGWRIAICARDVQELEGATRDIEQIVPGVLALPCDVADQSRVSLTIEKIIRHFGQIHVLVNNAGIIAVGPMETMTRQDFEHAMRVMFRGTVSATLAVLPEMIRRQSGRIVNVTNGRKGQRA